MLREVSKRFRGGILANDRVTVVGRPGEIHAVLGENGAGKTTAMRILAGLIRPDSGVVEVGGLPRHFGSPRDARQQGIGMVHQHFSLVRALTVAENLALGQRESGLLFRPRSWKAELAERAGQMGFDVRLDAPVSELSMGECQRVEIFRLLLEGARILILDEPTSILAPQEAQSLFEHLRGLSKRGCAVFLVTHKLEHVRAVADTVTVMRAGRVVGTARNGAWSEEQLLEMLVGRTLRPGPPAVSAPHQGGEPALRLANVTSRRRTDSRGLKRVSLEVHPGEIVGIAGFSGNGQEALVDAIAGSTRFSGELELAAANGSGARLAIVPDDRYGKGIAPSLSLGDNLALRCFRRPEYQWGPFVRRRKLQEMAQRLIAAFDIRPSDLKTPAGTLSGGNIQKLVLARELQQAPTLLVAVNPTAGLDVATVEFVRDRLLSLAREGVGILLVSEDLDELLVLCNRVLVMFESQVVARFTRAEFDNQRIGAAMVGLGNSTNRAEPGGHL